MSEHKTVLEHPTIGRVRGVSRVPDVVQYLGLKYATLSDRFARSELLESYSPNEDGVLDATKIGPIPLSPVDGCQWEHKLIQHSLPSPEFEQSDTECLTLNIAVPDLATDGRGGQPWPVLALVHGGAFATGSSSYPQYDLARIVQMSVEVGQPIIAVGINYRLGVPGFLNSAAMRSAGYLPNNGLWDQRLGLVWIKKYIAGFHGDPGRVTYIGESSGAASGFFHLHSKESLFSQLISMSGSSLVKAKQPESFERFYKGTLQLLGADEATLSSESAQVQHILSASMADIRDKIARNFPMGPVVDGEMIPQTTVYSQLDSPSSTAELFPGTTWCKRILIGDCQMDGNAYAPRVSSRSDILPRTLADHLHAKLDDINPTLVPTVIDGYGIDVDAIANTSESTKAVLGLATDICFGFGARAFAKAWSETGNESFLYRFNVPNPWDGPWKGHATHILDIAFVLQNYRDFLGEGQRKSGERFTRDVITFVSGGAPWTKYRAEEPGAMVYDAKESGEADESKFVGKDGEQSGRREVLLKLTGQGVLDKVMEAWEGFMKGPRQ